MAALVLLAGACASSVSGEEMTRVVESRLIAPCCWTQTLDVHESPLATELRDEIRTRLAAGESGERIEDDLAVRYGDRIRAVPRGADPRLPLGIATVVVVLAFGVALARIVRRWTRPGPDALPVPALPAEPDEYDAQITEALADLDRGR